MSIERTSSDPLVETCLSHLRLEHQALLALVETLLEIGDALKQHETTRLPALIDEKQAQMQRVSQIRQQRCLLKEQIALALSIEKDQVSIVAWAEMLDKEAREQVLEWRSRLLAVARRAVQLAQINMAVASRGMQILGQVMDCLIGQDGRSERYTANGRLSRDPAHPDYVGWNSPSHQPGPSIP